MEKNQVSLEALCAALCGVMGIEAPACAAKADERLVSYAKNAFGGKTADRIFMYNPDAIGQWIYQKYAHFMKEAIGRCELEVPYYAAMPSVTPVCFGTMYTGACPDVHGIKAYEKPVIKIDTIFDSLLRGGKRCAIVCTEGDSMSKIYLEREMDYYFYGSIEEVNAKAAELILEDNHDFIAVYNGNYDTVMHKFGPESPEALSELRANSHAFAMFDALIESHWKHHNALVGFAMDHGCHEIDGNCGSHGLDMPEDLNIAHLYRAHPNQ